MTVMRTPKSTALPMLLEGVAGPDDRSIVIQPKAVSRQKWSFHRVMNGADPQIFDTIKTGSGMAVAQAGGDLVITTGTNAYDETILRSKICVCGPFNLRYKCTLSQRIADQNFVVELVDKVGDDLPFTVNSATSITVDMTGAAKQFDAYDIGKGVWIGNISLASCPTQRMVIASVDGANVTFTVAGFPETGTGTCNLFGYNFFSVIYSGTSATTLGTGFTTQRMGWSETATSTTVNTTATAAPTSVLLKAGHKISLTYPGAAPSWSWVGC